jgi:acyl-[acyl carrier protein]--UDP-N-acetylglucosamine O-acyltransferase
MFSFQEFIKRIKWWEEADRLGPDLPSTHFRLFFPTLAYNLCKRKFAYFGEGANFRPYAYAINCSKIYIGRNVVIRPGTMLFASPDDSEGKIIIEDDVLIGSGVHVYVANHEYRNPNILISEQGHSKAKKVVLKRGCWIGANSIILPGVTVGEHSVVGAGSVVTKDVPPYTVAVGNPARVIKKIK